MPTSDRRARARRRPDEPPLRGAELQRAMHAAKGDPEAWAALRPRAIRGMTSKGISAEEAGAMYDAYGRKSYFMPSLPPSGYQGSDE